MRRAKEIARGRGEVRAGSRIKYFSSSPLPSLLPVLIELSSKSRRRCRRCRTDRLLRFRGGYTTALSHRLQLRVIGKLPCPHPSAPLASPSPHERLMEGEEGRRVANNVTQPHVSKRQRLSWREDTTRILLLLSSTLAYIMIVISPRPSGCCRIAWPRESWRNY